MRARDLERAAHLAGDLALADDDGLEPAGHGEQVLGDVVLGDDGARRPQLGRVDAGGVAAAARTASADASGPSRDAPSTSRYASNRLQVARTTAPLTSSVFDGELRL